MGKKKATAELIPAVAYLRKSTKGRQKDGKQRQEKSIGQQKEEITKLADGKYKIVAWFEDDGVSGWKRGAKRPDFQRMLDGVKSLGAMAVLCDNLDRFSRAEVDDVREDASALKKMGCRYIMTASHGEYDLGSKGIGDIIQFVVAVWSAHEYSRQLSRRVSLARRNQVADGKRPGGRTPYGYVADGPNNLKPGDPKEVKTVRWIFQQYAEENRSCNWIANELNKRKVKPPQADVWYVSTVQKLIKRKVYRGEMEYNLNPQGQFFRIDERGEVVETEAAEGGKVFTTRSAFEPLVTKGMFEKAQRRMQTVSRDRTRRKRTHYALTGILLCDHCGKPMHGCTKNKTDDSPGTVIYRCGTGRIVGKDACGNQQIRQDVILPWLMKLLGEEITDLQRVLTEPPEKLRRPRKAEQAKRVEMEERRADLAKRISVAEENLMFTQDKRSRQSMDKRLTELRDELEALEGELSEVPVAKGYTAAELEELNAWWEKFTSQAVPVPPGGKTKVPEHAVFWQDKESEQEMYLLDPLVVNRLLADLGAEVRLRWRTEVLGGRRRFVLEGGRFRLGQTERYRSCTKYLTETSVLRGISKVLPLLGTVDRIFAA